MAGPPGPLLVKACELAADGAWHDLEDMHDLLGQHIRPGEAWRRAEQERLRQVDMRGAAATKRVRPKSTEDILRTGRRSITREVLRGPRFERAEVDGRRRIRLRAKYLPQPDPHCLH